ncbi:hypothetical protein GCM10010448_65020 [Streptomyces glomeratus]|uniref:Uncharacterized protein n=1 Tax=Streptomyces glomeratus TaxID=284452 RepID=A0ABP6M662_9ACTN
MGDSTMDSRSSSSAVSQAKGQRRGHGQKVNSESRDVWAGGLRLLHQETWAAHVPPESWAAQLPPQRVTLRLMTDMPPKVAWTREGARAFAPCVSAITA